MRVDKRGKKRVDKRRRTRERHGRVWQGCVWRGGGLARGGFLLLGVAMALGLTGCGYQLGYRAAEGVRTVAVPIFENETGPRGSGSRRELEFELTKSVIREIQRRTPLIVVPNPDAADAVIRGSLKRIRESVVVEGPGDEVLRSSAQFELWVRVELPGRKPRTVRLVEVAEFEPGTSDTGTRDAAIAEPATEAFQRLAERVVMLLEE